MKHSLRVVAWILVSGIFAGAGHAQDPDIVGDVSWPAEWVIFAPAGRMAPPPAPETLRSIPDAITVGERTLEARRVRPTGNQFDFAPLFGPVIEGQTAYVFLPVEVAGDGEATLGFGADWWMQAWVNGELVLDTTDTGNDHWPPSIRDHRVTVPLRTGRNIVAIRFLSGTGSSILAAGGPRELRAPEPPSIRNRQSQDEFGRFATRLAEVSPPAPQPTPGWAPEFRRDAGEPGKERVAVYTDWGDNLLIEGPVTFGVPFPRGALPDASRARLVDAAGRAVPAEIVKRATWDGPGGPARWVWVHTRLRRGETYALEYGREVVSPEPEGVQVTEDDQGITVRTGFMRFVISKTQPTVIHSAALDSNGDGRFGPEDVIVSPGQAARALPSVTDAEGHVYAASPDGLKVEIAEGTGGMRAAIRREGWYVGTDGTRFCQFITYTYFKAGEPGFQHDHTLVVAFNTHHHQIRDVEIPLPLNLQGARRAWFARDESRDGGLIEHPVGVEPLSLIEHYRKGWRLLRGDTPVAEGERSGGWFGLADSRWGAFAGIEHFWQNSPAELEVSGNRLNLHLYASRETELLDFRPSRIYGQRDEEYPGDRVFHSRWYRDGLDEMTQGYGTAKTHAMHFRFFAEPDREVAARQARTVNQPIMAYADPEWACRTEAFGRVHPYDPERFPDLEAILDAIVHRRLWLRERLQNYGWFHFGDINGNLAYAGDPERVTWIHWRRWASMFHTNPNVMPLLYMRSGRRDAWDFHRVNTRHITDIDICHLDSEEFNKWRGGRYGGNGGIVHFAAELYGLGCDSHLRFMLYDYYLNANLRTWEVANDYAEAHAAHRTRLENLRYMHRHTGGPLRLFAEAYQATWNPEYLDIMRQFAQILMDAKEELGVTRYCDIYMNEGKILYYQATGDERMRDLFLSDMRILRRRRDAHVLEDTRHTTLFGPSHAYWMTGDRGFLPFALWQLELARERMIVEGDPGRVGSVDWTEETPYSATLGNQLPVIMAALADAGDPLPRPEGPASSFQTSGAFHFLQEQDGDIEIEFEISIFAGMARPFANWRAWAERLPEAERPALALIGPDGEEIRRIPLTGGADATVTITSHDGRRSTGISIAHPADGKTGTYSVHPVSPAVPVAIRLVSTNVGRWVMDTRGATVMLNPGVPYYARVPAGTGEFEVRFKTASLRGRQSVTVFNAKGEERGSAESGGRRWESIPLVAGRPDFDEMWRLRIFPNVRYGMFLAFDGMPGYLAGSPEAFFEPDREWHAPWPDPTPLGNGPLYRVADELGGAPVCDLPGHAAVRVRAPESGLTLPDAREGTLEMWVLCHRRPDEVQDRTFAVLGDLRFYRRAAIGTYVHVENSVFQTGFVPPPGRWTHLAAIWTPSPDGGIRVVVFADGVEVATTSVPRLDVSQDWPGEVLDIPRGESGLSIAGLRLSDRARYSRDFTPPPAADLTPDAHTRVLWPATPDGDAWVMGQVIRPQ